MNTKARGERTREAGAVGDHRSRQKSVGRFPFFLALLVITVSSFPRCSRSPQQEGRLLSRSLSQKNLFDVSSPAFLGAPPPPPLTKVSVLMVILISGKNHTRDSQKSGESIFGSGGVFIRSAEFRAALSAVYGSPVPGFPLRLTFFRSRKTWQAIHAGRSTKAPCFTLADGDSGNVECQGRKNFCRIQDRQLKKKIPEGGGDSIRQRAGQGQIRNRSRAAVDVRKTVVTLGRPSGRKGMTWGGQAARGAERQYQKDARHGRTFSGMPIQTRTKMLAPRVPRSARL